MKSSLSSPPCSSLNGKPCAGFSTMRLITAIGPCRAVFPGHRAIDALGAGEDHTLHAECPRRFQDVDQAHHVDLDAERRIGRGHRADEGRGMHHMRGLVLLDRLQDTRHVEYVALLEIE